MKEVTIVVAGKSKQGKSTVGEIIKKALEERGIDVRVFDNVYDENDDLEEGKSLTDQTEQVNVLVKVVTTTRNLELLDGSRS